MREGGSSNEMGFTRDHSFRVSERKLYKIIAFITQKKMKHSPYYTKGIIFFSLNQVP